MVAPLRWARWRLGFFQAKFEAHHEIHPGGRVAFEGIEDGSAFVAGDAVVGKDFVDFFFFVLGAFDDFAFFAEALRVVVVGIAAGGEVSAKTHGDGAGGDLGETGEDDDVGLGDDAGEAGGEGEGDGESVGHADDDVANKLAGAEMLLLVVVRVGVGMIVIVRHGD